MATVLKISHEDTKKIFYLSRCALVSLVVFALP